MAEIEVTIEEATYGISPADVKSERAKAIVTIVVVAIVNIANIFGYALDADAWINVVLSILSAVSIAWSWWKNQNVTEQAAQAQALLDALKDRAKLAKHAKVA